MPDFDMPEAGASFEERGGWVLNALMADLGLTQNQAAGIVGNIGAESVEFRTLQEMAPTVAGSRGGYGWAQWTGSRRRAFEEWCADEGLWPYTDEANYGFLYVELTGSHAYCVKALRRETELSRCVFVFGRLFEAPGGTTETYLPGFERRLKDAKRAIAGAAAQPAPQPSAPDSGGIFGRLVRKVFGQSGV
jgi:Phage tail lysozyme